MNVVCLVLRFRCEIVVHGYRYLIIRKTYVLRFIKKICHSIQESCQSNDYGLYPLEFITLHLFVKYHGNRFGCYGYLSDSCNPYFYLSNQFFYLSNSLCCHEHLLFCLGNRFNCTKRGITSSSLAIKHPLCDHLFTPKKEPIFT